MKTRWLGSALVVCLSLAFTSGLFAQDDVKSTVTTIEKNLWEAWKNNQTAAFEEHLADNSVSINPQGVSAGKEEAIKSMTGTPCDVRSFSFSDWQVHQLSSDTVLVTYKAKQDATCGGAKIPSNVVASSVYVKKDGKWLAASHQETPLMPSDPTRAE